MAFDSITVALLIICAVTLCGLFCIWTVRFRTWTGYRQILPTVQLFPASVRVSVARERADVVMRGNHRRWPVRIRFSDSDFAPELHIEMGIPANLTLDVLPRSSDQAALSDRLPLGTGDHRFDWLYSLFTDRHSDARMLLMGPGAMDALRAVCRSSQNSFQIKNRVMSLTYSVAPADLVTEVMTSLNAMATLAECAADMPGARRGKVAPYKKKGSSPLVTAAMFVGGVAAIAVVLTFRSPSTSASERPVYTLADGSAIDVRDAGLIPHLSKWKLATQDDFDPAFAMRLREAAVNLHFPLALHPKNSDIASEKVYLFVGVEGSKRLVILMDGVLVYDARYEKLAGVAPVPNRNLDQTKWTDSDLIWGTTNGDGLLVLVDPSDPQGARVFACSRQSVQSFTPQDQTALSLN